MGDGTTPLRVGILCDSAVLAEWQVRCLTQVAALNGVEVAALIVGAGHADATPASLPLLWRLYQQQRLSRKSRAIQPGDARGVLAGVARIDCVLIGPRDAAAAVAARNLDVLVQLGSAQMSGEMADAARIGLWSYRHGDSPAFWEIHDGEAVTGVALLRQSATGDGANVLVEAFFKTLASNLPASLDQLLFGASHFVARALSDLMIDGDARPVGGRAVAAQAERTMTNRAMLRFLWRTSAAWIGEQFGSLFRHQQWNVGFSDVPLPRLLGIDGQPGAVERRERWLHEERGVFLADPFAASGLSADGRVSILAERLVWQEGIGRIAAMDVAVDGSFVTRESGIARREHLSYPFLFEDGGAQYCMPECSASNGVTLYEYDQAAGRYRQGKTILTGFRAIDPTIFVHEGRYWLFCSSSVHGANEALFAFYADTIEGPWQPHRAAPLKIDIRSGRPAGPLFVHDGALYRPAQDCSRHYGGAITLNRIDRLDPLGYSETTVATLRPDPNGPYPAGLHTIQGLGETCLIDGARWTFVGTQFLRAARAKLDRLTRRDSGKQA